MTVRSACWSVTAFDGEIEMIQVKEQWPVFVKELYGGVEKCPTTQKEHYQGCVVLSIQQRLSAMKKWLPKAHWEPAKSKEALKKYAMKEETAVGEKTVIKNIGYLRTHQVLKKMGQKAIDLHGEYQRSCDVEIHIYDWMCHDIHGNPIPDYRYTAITRRLVSDDITFLDFITPQIKKMWITYHEEVIKHISRITSITDSRKGSSSEISEISET